MDFIGSRLLDATLKGYQDEHHAVVECALAVLYAAHCRPGTGDQTNHLHTPESFEVVEESSPPVDNEFEGTSPVCFCRSYRRDLRGGAQVLAKLDSISPEEGR